MNRAGWSGLYRVNANGHFNVPHGKATTEVQLDVINILACSRLLNTNSVEFRTGDFEASLKGVKKGDLVFLDPPYVTGHNQNGFVEYNQKLFSWEDQIRLANKAELLRRQGAFVVITNAAHNQVIDLYPHFNRFEFERHSTLATNPSKRRRIREVVFHSS